MTRTDAIELTAWRLCEQTDRDQPDPLDYIEAEAIIDEVASWR